MKHLFDTNWEELLEDNEVATRVDDGDSMQVVLLAGLQRLARQANLIKQTVDIFTPSDKMVQAVFSATFNVDGNDVQFVGAADCNSNNTKGKYMSYPTAVAESRAEARCLRKALGIRMLSSEEIGFKEGAASLEASPTARVSSSLVAAIEKLCESRGVQPVQVLEEVLDSNRASTIFELSELTTDEAQKAMSWLNEQKPSSTSKRDARKAELQAKQEKD